MNIKKIACLLSITLCLSAGTATKAKAAVTPERIGGATRYDTAVSISQNGWNSTSEYAIIASGQDFGDALSAAPLAKKYNAPILLASRDNLDNQAGKAKLSGELSRLKVKKAFLIGGTGAISTEVEKAIKDKGIEVERVAGKDRYDTSIEIAKRVGVTNGIVLTTGDDFTDALTMAPIAASKGMPIILVPKNGITTEIKNYIEANKNIPKTYVVGDNNLIEDETVKEFSNIERISGEDEYKRNLNILDKFAKDFDYNTVYLTSRSGFADALSGSALASLTTSPVILVKEGSQSEVQSYLKDKLETIGQVNVLGGDGVVSNTTLEAILPMSKNQAINSGFLKASMNQQNINSMESDSDININASAKGLPQEGQKVADEIVPVINNSKMAFNIKMNSNDAKTFSNVQEDITMQIAGMNIQTTVWVTVDVTGNEPKFKEIVKIPEVASKFLPPEFAGKKYIIMDPIAMTSTAGVEATNFNALMNFGKNFQPQFQSFMKKYAENWNPGFNFINYKGLMRMDTKEGVKYAQTYNLKLTDANFKAIINYTANDFVQNKEFINFIKQFMVTAIDLSGEPDKEIQKQELDKVFNDLSSNPQEAMKNIKIFMDAIKDLKVIGDKGIDITYNICDGYIIGESGVIDLQLDIHKVIEVGNRLSNNPNNTTTEDIKGILGLGFNFNMQNYNINKDVKIEIPQITKENSIDYMDLMKSETGVHPSTQIK